MICWPRKHDRPITNRSDRSVVDSKSASLYSASDLLAQHTSLLCVCVHAQTQLTSDSAIVNAPLPLDTARKDISNTNEGMRARLSLRPCPCQPMKPSLSNSVVQRACAKDHHYHDTSHGYTNASRNSREQLITSQ